VILKPHKNFPYNNENKCEKNQNDNDVKKKKNDKMQHKFTNFGVQIRTFNTAAHFLDYDIFYTLNSFQFFDEVREEEIPIPSSSAVFGDKRVMCGYLRLYTSCQKGVNFFPVVTNDILGTLKMSEDVDRRNIRSLFNAPFFLHNIWNYCGADSIRGSYPGDFFLGKSQLVLVIYNRYITMSVSAATRFYRLQYLRFD
jgi:hypothetical protein